MGRETALEMPSQSLRIFTFRPRALFPYVLSFLFVSTVMIAVMLLFILWDAEGSFFTLRIGPWTVDLPSPPLLALTVPIAFSGAYTLYLILVLKSATLMATEYGITYADRWVRKTIKWSDIVSITPFGIYAASGTGIPLRLGLKGLDGWTDLVNLLKEKTDAQLFL
ncbi:MAG: hypothetical protein NZ959_07240 [Armatimonadetes bacterium]|nr:hypothetical protein [Armatimonadota bacterium]MDW8122307.1 hypothetical protein [Armatimonadota bacterium]